MNKTTKKKDFFGYLELEIEERKEFHCSAIKLNSARSAIAYVLRAKKYESLLIPYYLCSSVKKFVETFAKDTSICQYSLDEQFFPQIQKIKKNEAILYPNYFGIFDKKADQVCNAYENVILDATQAFYYQPTKKADICYSPRKFFGVSDGGYLYTNRLCNGEIPPSYSYKKILPLLKRVELGAKEGYPDFLNTEKTLSEEGIRSMSLLTQKILCGIDHKKVKHKRNRNFKYLHKVLREVNLLTIPTQFEAPMCYPLLLNKKGNALRKHLVSKKIYVPQWWKDVLLEVPQESLEAQLSENLIPLPVDQRYSEEDLDYIAKSVLAFV